MCIIWAKELQMSCEPEGRFSKKRLIFLWMAWVFLKLYLIPKYLAYTGLRVKIRFLMYNWLKNKGKVGPLALSTPLASSDEKFRKSYVSTHPQGPWNMGKVKSRNTFGLINDSFIYSCHPILLLLLQLTILSRNFSCIVGNSSNLKLFNMLYYVKSLYECQ